MVEYMEIGQILNTNGLKGVMKVNPFTDDITRFGDLTELYIEQRGNLQKFKIQSVRYQKNLVYLKLQGIDTIEEAEKYRECYLKIDRKDAIPLSEDTYFIVDLLGIEVFEKDNRIRNTGGHLFHQE